MPLDHVGDLAGPERYLLGAAWAGQEVDPGRRGTDLVDRLDAVIDVFRAHELVEHDRSLRRHEGPAGRRMQGPDLHVPAPRRIADIDGVGEKTAHVVAPLQLRAHAAQPPRAQFLLIDRSDAAGDIEAEGGRGSPVGCHRASFRAAAPASAAIGGGGGRAAPGSIVITGSMASSVSGSRWQAMT